MSETNTAVEFVQLSGGQFEVEKLAAGAQRTDRTARVVWYSGAAIERSDYSGPYVLEFDMRPEAVRLERLNGGAPVLKAHADDDLAAVLGVVERAWLDNGRGLAQVRFSARADVDPIWQDIVDGIIRHVSMGALIYRREEVQSQDGGRRYRATDWEPVEISIVPVAADAGAGFKATLQGKKEGKRTMQQMQNADAQAIRKIVLTAKLPEAFAEGLIAAGANVEQARTAVLERLAEESEKFQVRTHSAVVTRDYREGLSDRMGEALACRYTGKAPSDGAREWVGASLADMARECLTAAGRHVTTRNSAELVRLALTTSDFPNLLSGAGQRILLDGYQAAQPEIKQVCRQSTARDFRAKTVIRLGEMPELLKVNEHGEITYGAAAEAAASYKLATYARIFAITRQALVNDDLGAFADFARAYGVAAATLEGKILSDLLISNPIMPDGVALFHANHGNLGTGSGSALGLSALSVARAAMRTRKGLDGVTVLDLQPRFLLVPAALQTMAEQLVSSIYPASPQDANPFVGRLTVVVDPRLDAASPTAWYLLADPAIAPTLEFSYLDEAPGPQVDFRTGFEVDGVEWRCRLDYGAGALDWRGAYKATGA
jgi:phage major head subunit gpT-like protein